MIHKNIDNSPGNNDFQLTVQTYYQDIKRYNPISRKDERALLEKAKNGDVEARNKIISSNLRFVFDMAKKYRDNGVELCDLISIGNCAMMTAIDKFDLSNDVKFISYAVWWIRKEMSIAINTRKRIDEIEYDITDVFNRYGKEENVVMEDNDDDDDYNDMSDDSEEIILRNEENDQKHYVVETLLSSLNAREKSVLVKYFGIEKDDDGHNLDEISNELHITKERVRQIKSKAIDELRAKVFSINEANILFR